MRRIAAFILASALALPLCTATAAAADLTDLHFLVGRWTSGEGLVADTRQRSTGTSTITEEAGGGALLRREHVELTSATGQSEGGFDIVMLIYRNGDTINATYVDGTHVIDYTSALVVPGASVTFLTDPQPGRPAFRLAYRLRDPNTLAITFEIAAPGQTAFAPIATGTLQRAP